MTVDQDRDDYWQGVADNWNEVPYDFRWSPERRRGYEDAILIVPAEPGADNVRNCGNPRALA